MARITLLGGKGFAQIDDADVALCHQYNSWELLPSGYVRTRWREPGARHHKYLHQIIAEAKYGRIHRGLEPNHISLDKLDNRRGNLELCTRRENLTWTRKRMVQNGRMAASPFKGVRFEPRSQRNPWVAVIKVSRRSRYIGCYPTQKQAALAYDAEARKCFTRPWLNFVTT